MPDTQGPIKRVRAFLRNKSLVCLERKFCNLISALLLSVIFTLLLFLCRPDTILSGITAALFGAAGTIVALALPAAELGGQSVARIAAHWLKRSKDKQDPLNFDHALASLREVKKNASIARRGSIFVLVAFFVAAFALLTPRVQVNAEQYLRIDYLLTGIASGFLLVGAVLFFPFAWSVYRLDTLHDMETYISGLKSLSKVKDQPGEKRITELPSPNRAQSETASAKTEAQAAPATTNQSTLEPSPPARDD